jgi:hypothetical protein
VHLSKPTAEKRLMFVQKMDWDSVRFYRLHGLDGSEPIGLTNSRGVGIRIYMSLNTRGIRIRAKDRETFWLPIGQRDDLKFIIQLQCKEYNRETRKCRIHPSRPDICRRWPVHPGQVQGTPCAFRFVPEEVEMIAPDGVRIKMVPAVR